MTIRVFNRSVLLCGLTVFLLFSMSVEASRPVHEEAREPGWFRLLRPRMDDPAAQLAYADELREVGRRRGAQRQYRALVRYWPGTREAAQAQYAYAKLLEERSRRSRALDEYANLLEDYTGMIPHQDVRERLFDMGTTTMDERRAQFLFFPGFHAPERAIPYFEAVVKHGPQWKRAPEAQYHIGRIKEKNRRYEEAVFAYDRVGARYPRSPFAEDAAFGRARVLYRLSREAPNHLDGAETALHALASFLRSYPESEHAGQAREYMRTVYGEMARLNYERARYYDRIARRPRAAITTYERFLKEYPDSEWADQARERLDQLRTKMEEHDEKETRR